LCNIFLDKTSLINKLFFIWIGILQYSNIIHLYVLENDMLTRYFTILCFIYRFYSLATIFHKKHNLVIISLICFFFKIEYENDLFRFVVFILFTFLISTLVSYYNNKFNKTWRFDWKKKLNRCKTTMFLEEIINILKC